ncbi:MAG: hypothetical protein RLZZ175_3328, partial [Bacteroidota bacterium]
KLKRYQGQLKDLIKGNFNSKDFHVKQLNGVQLNKAWASYSKKLDNENNKAFAIRNYNFIKEKNEFTTDDLIDIFNFYRLFGQKIDELIMNKIERKKILMFCYNYYTNYYNLKEKESIEKFLPRFKRVCVISVNLQLDDKEVREFYLDV